MRNAILDAAMRVYARKGYHAATIADVAGEAGLGKGTLYLYFKNKDAIAVAMVDRHFSQLEQRLLDIGPPVSLEELGEMLSRTLEIPEENTRFIRVFFEVFGPSFASETFSAEVAGSLTGWATSMPATCETCRRRARSAQTSPRATWGARWRV